MPARCTPAGPHRWLLRFRFIYWTPNQCQSVEIHDIPLVAVHSEREALFSPLCVHHKSFAIFHHVENTQPQFVADSGRNLADEHTWADLQKPPSQMAPQPRRAGGEDHDYHGSSESRSP